MKKDYKLELMATKLSFYIDIFWGLLVLFALVGFASGHEIAKIVLIVISSSWVLFEIVERGFHARRALKSISVIENALSNKDKNDGV